MGEQQQGSFHVAFKCETEACRGSAIVSAWDTIDKARKEADRLLGARESTWAACPECGKSRKYGPSPGNHDTYPYVIDSSVLPDPGFEVAELG